MKMIVLDSTKSIQIVLLGAKATNDCNISVDWQDNNGSIFTESSTESVSDGITPVTICAAPATGYRRIVRSLNVINNDTAPVTIILNKMVSGVATRLAKITLNVDDVWTLEGTYTYEGSLKSSGTKLDITSYATMSYVDTVLGDLNTLLGSI